MDGFESLDILGSRRPEQSDSNLTNADDIMKIRDIMQSRREEMYEQIRASDIQSAICDQFRTEKLKQDGLAKRIVMLETTDPELFKYIRSMETFQAGVWCHKCHTVKTIGGSPSSALTESPEESHIVLAEPNEILSKFTVNTPEQTGELKTSPSFIELLDTITFDNQLPTLTADDLLS